MQVGKYIGQAFSHTGVFEVINVITTKNTTVYCIKIGEFINKTWGNDHPQVTEMNGVKVLAINKTNFKFIRKLTSLEEELY